MTEIERILDQLLSARGARGNYRGASASTDAAKCAQHLGVGASHRRLGKRRASQVGARVPESRLGKPILEGMSTVYVTLHGIIQHDLYHTGQISMLKKA